MIYSTIILGLLVAFPVLCYVLWRSSAKLNNSMARLALRSLILAVVFAPVPIYPMGIGEYFVPNSVALLFYGVQPSALENENSVRMVSLMLGCIFAAWLSVFGAGVVFAAVRRSWGQGRR